MSCNKISQHSEKASRNKISGQKREVIIWLKNIYYWHYSIHISTMLPTTTFLQVYFYLLSNQKSLEFLYTYPDIAYILHQAGENQHILLFSRNTNNEIPFAMLAVHIWLPRKLSLLQKRKVIQQWLQPGSLYILQEQYTVPFKSVCFPTEMYQ